MKTLGVQTLLISSAVVLAACFASILGQPLPSDTKSPREVLEEFLKCDLDGGRLTPKGNHELSNFFVKEGELQKDAKIIIVSKEYDLQQRDPIGERATFILQFAHFYGKLDPAAHFEPAAETTANGAPIKGGILASFTLTKTSKQSDSQPAPQESAKPGEVAEWRIDGPQPPICISLSTAIRYLTEVSKTDDDPNRRSNAARALTRLRNMH